MICQVPCLKREQNCCPNFLLPLFCHFEFQSKNNINGFEGQGVKVNSISKDIDYMHTRLINEH
uniref:Uncharacterized protein n=1 Tax=Megaselia scalaris TaxID=36166 RepID=T1GHA4_MEGSC